MNNTPGFDGLLKVIEQMIDAHRNDARDRILRKICVVLKFHTMTGSGSTSSTQIPRQS